MNKYVKIAIEQKLEDNGVGIGDKFKVDGWNADWYIYNGHTIWNKVFGCFDKIVEMNETNQYTFLNNEIIKLDEYIKIDFETAYKMMCGGDIVYLRNFKGESIVELRISTSSDGWEYIVSKPWHGGNMKFSNLCEYEFYKKS